MLKQAYNTTQALKAAGKLISGTIKHSASVLIYRAGETRWLFSHLLFTSMHSLERFEDLSTALRISPRRWLTLLMQSEPIVQLRKKHPLSDISNKLFTSLDLSDLLNELYGEAEAKRCLRDTESALAAVKSLLHINSHLCFGFLSLIHLTDTVLMVMATRVLFKLYCPVTDQSHHSRYIPHLIIIVDISPSSTSGKLNRCHSLLTASNHWWQARLVISENHSPFARWTVGRDWVYFLW